MLLKIKMEFNSSEVELGSEWYRADWIETMEVVSMKSCMRADIAIMPCPIPIN
jgi:hypothetical protein